jgi:hypothetical protein
MSELRGYEILKSRWRDGKCPQSRLPVS